MDFQGESIQKNGFPGGVNTKKWISRGSQYKKMGKFQRVNGKFDWKSREVKFKKIDILTGGGVQFFNSKSSVKHRTVEVAVTKVLKSIIPAIS